MNKPFYFEKLFEFGYNHIRLYFFLSTNVPKYNLPHHMELVLEIINIF